MLWTAIYKIVNVVDGYLQDSECMDCYLQIVNVVDGYLQDSECYGRLFTG